MSLTVCLHFILLKGVGQFNIKCLGWGPLSVLRFKWELGWLVLIINLTKPRITWEEGFIKGLHARQACLRRIFIVG